MNLASGSLLELRRMFLSSSILSVKLCCHPDTLDDLSCGIYQASLMGKHAGTFLFTTS